MQWSLPMILLPLVLLLFLLTVSCDGPAEEAGKELDARVEEILQEANELKAQVDQYQGRINESRRELEAVRQELEDARQNRDRLINEMEQLQTRKEQMEGVRRSESNGPQPAIRQ